MIQDMVDPVLIAVVGVGAAAFGAVNQLAKWGLETLRTKNRSNGSSQAKRSGNGRQIVQLPPECDVLMKQTHGLVISTDRRLEVMEHVLGERLKAMHDTGREQLKATKDLGDKIIALARDRDDR